MDAVEQDAARWVVRRNGAAPDALPDARFTKWYGASDQHARCYDSVAALWRQMNQVSGDALRQDLARDLQRRKRRGKIIAAVSCSVAFCGVFLWQSGAWWRWQADAVTAAGEIREVVLADGSRVLLDAQSAIRSDLSGTERRVTLLRGRALFTVARDPQRPFVVATPEARATALGTRYEVCLLYTSDAADE